MDYTVQVHFSSQTFSSAYPSSVSVLLTGSKQRLNYGPFLRRDILVAQSAAWCRSFFQLLWSLLSGPPGCRITRRNAFFSLPNLRCNSLSICIDQRFMDDGWRFPHQSRYSQRLLEIHLLSDRLSTFYIHGTR